MTTDVHLATAGLMRLSEGPHPALAEYVDRAGPVTAWQEVLDGSAPEPVLAAVAARRRSPAEMIRRAAADLAAADMCRARLVTQQDPEWVAASLFGLTANDGGHGPPLGLYIQGRVLPETHLGCVSIVGARDATDYGRAVAGHLAAELAEQGCPIVSGAAFGIDAAAHRGALAVGGYTIAVLACGIDRAYPVAHTELLRAIAAEGSLISEYPPGTHPARYRFLDRNRLIAALAEVTVVVEAGGRSGALNTARTAARINRVLMAVPGPVTSALSLGCHRLIRDDGALLAGSAAQIREAMCGGDLEQLPLFDRPLDSLGSQAARVYEALPATGRISVEQLAYQAAIGAREVLGLLAELELGGFVQRAGAQWQRVSKT